MSHTTTIKTLKIQDTKAIESAVKDLQAKGIKCELLKNTTPRMYSDAQARDVGKCDYVLKLNDSPYDVGFVKQADGSYAPAFDEFRGAVGSQIGAACPMPNTKEGRAQHQIGQFMQNYAKHAAMNAARAKGHMVQGVTVDQSGKVHLTITGY